MKILLINPALPGRSSDNPAHFLQSVIADERDRINRNLFERHTRPRYAELGIVKTFYDYPGYTASLGLLSLAAVLRRAGHQVDYVQLSRANSSANDCGLDVATTVTRAGAYELVGITALCTNIDVALGVLSAIKSHHGDRVYTVIGGPEVSEADGELGDMSGVDYLVKGEGELIFPELVGRLERGESVADLAGIRYRTDAGLLDNPGFHKLSTDELQQIPAPAYDLIGDDPNTQIYAQFARGCDFRCRFCSEGPGTRYFSQAQMEASLRALESYRSANLVFVIDDNFGGPTSKAFLEDFERAVAGSQTSNFFYVQTRVKGLTEDKLERYYESRVINYFFGIESTSDHVLKVSNKHTTWDEILTGLRIVRDFFAHKGFALPPYRCNFIQGLPGESTEISFENLARRQKLLDEGLMVTVHDNIFHPVPGSVFYERPRKYGIQLPRSFRTGLRWALPNYEGTAMSRTALFLHHLQMRQLVNDALIERHGLGDVARATRARLAGDRDTDIDNELERC